ISSDVGVEASGRGRDSVASHRAGPRIGRRRPEHRGLRVAGKRGDSSRSAGRCRPRTTIFTDSAVPPGPAISCSAVADIPGAALLATSPGAATTGSSPLTSRIERRGRLGTGDRERGSECDGEEPAAKRAHGLLQVSVTRTLLTDITGVSTALAGRIRK